MLGLTPALKGEGARENERGPCQGPGPEGRPESCLSFASHFQP